MSCQTKLGLQDTQKAKCVEDGGEALLKLFIYVLYLFCMVTTLLLLYFLLLILQKKNWFYVTKSLSFVNKSNVRYIKEI